MDVSRRQFLKVLGLGSAATLSACSAQPPERLVPYLVPVEEIVPGQALWYATVCRECPAECGMLVRTREGRAVKVEGNPDHPVNRGRLCARGQASLQGLYNPDRLRQPLVKDGAGLFQPVTWEEAERWLTGRLAEIRAGGKGQGVTWLTGHLTGTLDRLIDHWLHAMGSSRRLRYEPLGYQAITTANRLSFGIAAIPTYDLASTEAIVSFGAEFLETWLSPVMYARQFAAMRAVKEGRIGRFVFVGPRLSMTAANADEWLPVVPGTEGVVALGLARSIVHGGRSKGLSRPEAERFSRLLAAYTPARVAAASGVQPEQLERIARILADANPGLALGGGPAVGGPHATATLVAINLLNHVTGNMNRTVRFGPVSSLARLASYREVLALVEEMNRGQISALFVSEANPVFSLPAAAGFTAALAKVPLIVACSSVMDETTAEAHLALPIHTPLESWGDAEPWSGIHALLQPSMEPLFETRSLGDLLLSVARRLGGPVGAAFEQETFYDLLRASWRALHRRLRLESDFETFWVGALRRGGFFEDASSRPVRFRFGAAAEAARALGDVQPAARNGEFTLLPFASLAHFDGRGANRPWLQELPDPMAQLTWESWLEVHPDDAKRLGIGEGDLVQVRSEWGEIHLPAHLYAGLKRGVVAVPVGQGHTAYGRYAKGAGANPLRLLPGSVAPSPDELPWLSARVSLARTGTRRGLASVSGSERQHDRGIAQVVSLAQIMAAEHAEEAPHRQPAHAVRQIYPPHEHPDRRWGMAIDLNACIGCSACVVACYAENNIPVVGREQVARGREMSWIRIERFIEGTPDRPDVRFVPMLCQHCDNAPCEPVCPVYATVHNPEGLNIQVYNRCVGTRYCSNNCPYKVRRFNWFTFEWPKPLPLQLNPDVTVREKGVMEKCTFCVQRIAEGKARAKDEGRPLKDGEIVPACAQTCPTRAIVFGDLRDPTSEVSRVSRDPRRYRILEQLNTQPAVTYLKKIVVPSSEVPGSSPRARGVRHRTHETWNRAVGTRNPET